MFYVIFTHFLLEKKSLYIDITFFLSSSILKTKLVYFVIKGCLQSKLKHCISFWQI